MARKKINDNDLVNKKEDGIDIEKIKEELNKYIDDKIRKEFNIELERANKRIIRDKNIKIITKNMVITILLLIIVYLVYILNDLNYFDKFFVENTNKITNRTNNTIEDKEVSLDELKKEYSFLLDNIYINEESEYIEEYYNGNLTSELKNYLTLNMIDNTNIDKEDDYNIIDESVFKNKYKKLFKTTYDSISFKYNNNYIRYINKIDSYISDGIINKIDSNIKREIIAIDTSDDITITTVEGLVKDNIIYNILTGEEIAHDDDNILNYIDRLNTLKYVFDNEDRLISISK